MHLSFYIIIHAIVSIVTLALGLLVIYNKREKLYVIFSLLALSISLWAGSYSLWLLSSNYSSALFWSRTLNLFAIFIPVFYLHWVVVLLKLRKKNLLLFYYFIIAIFVLFSYSHFYIKNVKHIMQFPYWPQAGWLYVLFLVFVWGSVFVYNFYLLIREFKKAQGYYKLQLGYVIIGSVIGFIGGSTNYLLMFDIGIIPPVGSFLVVAYPVFFLYSIVVYNLMDIKLTLRKSFVFLSSLIFVFVVVILIKVSVYRYIPDVYYSHFLLDLVVFSLAVINFPKVGDYFFKIANKYFFTTLYDSGALNSEINEIISSNFDFQKVYSKIDIALRKTFHIKSFGVLVYDKKVKKYKIKYNSGIPTGRKSVFEIDNFIIDKNEPVILSYLNRNNRKIPSSIKELKKYDIEVITPLKSDREIFGVLLLGKKENGEMYNSDDIGVLKVISSQIVLSSENMKYYEEIRNRKAILEKKIKKKRSEIQLSNEQLQGLDKTKSEFISIVSHQLRTPLTVIKGYTSMILEGSFGKVKRAKKLAFMKVLKSSEKLIQMVENLLYLSRIESKKLVFNFEYHDFEHLVSDVISKYQYVIDKKKLNLIYKESRKKIGDIYMDTEKIRLVVVNLIETILKYNDSDEIFLSTKIKNKKVMFYVSGTGRVIPKDKLECIFKKFTKDEDEMGIDLYISKKIIDGHKGTLVVQNKKDATGIEAWFII